jgi:hypothetical protein
MRKVWIVTLALLRQHRWYLLLVAIWPWLFTLFLVYWGGSPAAEDIVSLLHQECFYGLALSAVLAASAYRTELRSRRTVAVLIRAVSRTQYLAALWLSAVIPGLFYIASLLGSGRIAIANTGLSVAWFHYMLAALLVLTIWVSSVGLLFSLFLPGLIASLAVGAIAALSLYLAGENLWLGLGVLVREMMHAPQPAFEIDAGVMMISIVNVLAQAAVVTFAANAIFRGKDISSVGE